MENNNNFANAVISSQGNSEFDVAYKYISIICTVNNIRITKRELQLLSFISLNRDISSGGKKEEFAQQVNTSLATISNMIFRMKKIGLLIIKDKKTILHPSIHPLKEMLIHVKLKG